MDGVLVVLAVHSLGLIIPGPDFFLTLRHATRGSKKEGLWTAFGLTCGMSTLAVGGVFVFSGSAALAQSIIPWIRFLGAGYLCFLGWGALTSKMKFHIDRKTDEKKKIPDGVSPFLKGLLCNMSNPKALLFFVALFSVVGVNLSSYEKVLAVCGMASLTFLWFGTLAIGLKKVIGRLPDRHIGLVQTIISKGVGIAFIGFALVLLFSPNITQNSG